MAVLEKEGGWSRVRLQDGTVGWAASRYLRTVKDCPPDRDFRVVDAPPLALSDGTGGTVQVEATVGPDGKVKSARITKNTTGDSALAAEAEKEIRSATFEPPIRKCLAKSFIYLYTKTY